MTLLLTTGETYFFRDRGQLNLIQETILPEIIARKLQAQAIGKAKPSLRIWSAGCSTGEEPYSLATISQELIPNYLNWNLLILGTDINTESIAKAKVGSYSEWSFRMVSPDIKRRYFCHQDKSWQLDDRIRRMVTFRPGNLLTDDYPRLNSDIYNMDIIICRNVFIYFNAENVETILGKFYQTLSPGGYLIVGHTELHDLNLKGFVPKAYGESVVYLRSEDIQHKQPASMNFAGQSCAISPQALSYQPSAIKPRSLTQQPSQVRHVVTPQPHTLGKSPAAKTNPIPTASNLRDKSVNPSDLCDVQTLFDNGNYALAVQQVEQILKQQPDNFEAIYLIAQSCANQGQSKRASYYCERAIAINPLSVKIYYLLAHIAEEQNNLSQVKEYLKRIIYIDGLTIAAYLDLGSIYNMEGDTHRAKKMFDTATELLKEMSPDTIIQYRGKAKVAELLEQVKANLQN